MKVTSTQGPYLIGNVQDQESVYQPQGNQVGFEQILKLLMNLLIFSNGEQLFIVSLLVLLKTRLIKFLLPCSVNLLGHNFLNRTIN